MQRSSNRPEEAVPYVIVVGSEKGGTGKSTTAIHLAVALMKLGFRVDTPGSDSYLCRLGHNRADTLITPLNDSFLDIGVLAQINRERREVEAPSVYSQLVWEQNNQRVVAGRPPIDWVILRNRLAHIEARNMREISALLDLLAKRIGFRTAPGISERVVFRELFMKGLTALDLPDQSNGLAETRSHAAARREIQDLLAAIGLFESEPA
jgi:chromosome partitioning protein